jgi:hypothetical protein
MEESLVIFLKTYSIIGAIVVTLILLIILAKWWNHRRDLKKLVKGYHKALDNGYMTVNEVRTLANMRQKKQDDHIFEEVDRFYGAPW